MLKTKAVLVVKIFLTLLFWAIPLLTFPEVLIKLIGFPIGSILFLRLLGAAYLSLTVSYYFALLCALKGVFPTGGIWTGVISNGMASSLIGIYFLTGGMSSWGYLAQIYMGISALVAGILCLIFLFICIGFLFADNKGSSEVE